MSSIVDLGSGIWRKKESERAADQGLRDACRCVRAGFQCALEIVKLLERCGHPAQP